MYEGHSTNKVKYCLKSGHLEAVFYGCTFFKQINTDRLFHVPEECQHNLLY